MKLKSKFILLAAAAVSVAIGNSWVSYWSGEKMYEVAQKQEKITQIIQRHMEGDMKHDAIWGDVMSVLVMTQTGNQVRKQEYIHSAHADLAAFRANIDTNKQADVPPAIRAQLEKASSALEAYRASAEIILNASDNFESASAMTTGFHDMFLALKKEQDKTSEMMLVWAEETKQYAYGLNTWTSDLKLVLSLGNLLLAWIVPIFAIRAIFRPQAQMIDAMNHIAKGDTAMQIPHTGRSDEMGDMARTVQVFKENAQRVVQLAEEQKLQQERAEEHKKQALQGLATSFESNVKKAVDMVASAATQMDATSRSVAKIVDTNKTKLGTLNTQIQGTTRNVQTVADATSQLSRAVNEINQQVTRATAITHTAVNEAEKADGTVQGLSAAAQKIGEVLEMINSITAQINLLALNATIEAARAGDAGKGFAVVASEVKSLASQTSKATEEIVQHIASIQAATGETVNVIKTIGSTIREINEISTTIAAAVEEQGAATRDIASNVQQAAQSTDEVSRNANDVAASSNETGTAANLMTDATSELSRQSETLRTEVDKFLAGVRAG